MDAIHATLPPVLAYVGHISELTGKPHRAITIPAGSAAYSMGYRFVSIPLDELDHYLANGAIEATR
jgi:hypothetical protein